MSEDFTIVDEMVIATFDALEDSGFTHIKACDFDDVAEPEIVNGHTPELTANNKKGTPFVFDVLLKDDFADPALADRFMAFVEWADATEGQFTIVVPEGDAGIAYAFLEEHDIPEERIDVWEA